MIEFLQETLSGKGETGGAPRVPPLGELEQAQLYSCLDLLRDRMGDALVEQAAVDAILAANFDAEKALDQLLKNSTSTVPKVAPKINVRSTFSHPSQGMSPLSLLSWV